MPHISRFNHAFAEWNRADLDRAHRLWDAPSYGDEEVMLRLNRFAPHIVVQFSRRGVNIAVEWEEEWWDLLFTDDVVAERGPMGGWRCALCLEPNQGEFVLLEQLWAHHLFDAAVRYIEERLVPANALWLCQYKGARWAIAGTTAPVPIGAHYAVFPVELQQLDAG